MSGSLIQFWMDAEQNSWSEYAPWESFRRQTRQTNIWSSLQEQKSVQDVCLPELLFLFVIIEFIL